MAVPSPESNTSQAGPSPLDYASAGQNLHLLRHDSLASRFESLVARDPDATMLSQASLAPDDNRSQIGQSRRSVQLQVHKIANWLLEQGNIQQGDRVGIISATWPEAGVCDMAALDAHACNVILYPTDLPAHIAYKLWVTQAELPRGDSTARVKVVFADNQTQVDKLYDAQGREYEFEHPVTHERVKVKLEIERIVCFQPAVSPAQSEANTRLHSLENVIASDCGHGAAPHTLHAVRGEDLAYFIFTSGSTSIYPKAVEVRHRELINNLDATFKAGMFHEGDTAFLPLPLSHSFGQHFKLQSFVNGLVVAYPSVWDRQNSDLNEKGKLSIVADMGAANADVIPTVPSMLSKFRKKIIDKSQNALMGLPLRAALWSHRELYNAEIEGTKPHFMARPVAALTAAIAHKVQQKLFGKNFKFAIPGGGFLDPEIYHFFESLGMKVCPGYGFTEASVVVAVIHPERPMPGSVGEILDEFEVDVRRENPGDKAGRLFFRGPSIMQGYANNPEASAKAIDRNGWYDSQDFGYVREVNGRRYLYIVGRSEEREVLSTGENIAVVPIQEHLKQSRYINEIVVTGQDRRFLVGLVDINRDAVRAAIEESQKIKLSDFSEEWQRKCMEDFILERIRHHEDTLGLRSYERTKYVHIIDESPSVDNGMLTPTFKVKRGRMIEMHREQLEEMWNRKR